MVLFLDLLHAMRFLLACIIDVLYHSPDLANSSITYEYSQLHWWKCGVNAPGPPSQSTAEGGSALAHRSAQDYFGMNPAWFKLYCQHVLILVHQRF